MPPVSVYPEACPSVSVASAAVPSPHQSAPNIRGDARFSPSQAHRSSYTTNEQSRNFHNIDFATDSEYSRDVDLEHAPWAFPSTTPRSSSGGPSRVESFNQLQAHLDGMYAEEHDLQSGYNQLQAVETERADDDDRALSNYQL